MEPIILVPGACAMKTTSLLLTVLALSSWAVAQRNPLAPKPVNPAPVIQHGVDMAQTQSSEQSASPVHQQRSADRAKLRQDADELASLAKSIPPAIDQTTRGLLPEDLDQKLKRIEKLAKQLRSRISQ
jgi:hypothetical protein